jgi:hypothetical protein
MAGDRGLAFVVVGMISLSALWLSNQRRAELRSTSAEVQSAAPNLTVSPSNRQLPAGVSSRQRTRRTGVPRLVDQTPYVFNMRDYLADSVIATYPELSRSIEEGRPRIKQRLRLVDEYDSTPSPAPPIE